MVKMTKRWLMGVLMVGSVGCGVHVSPMPLPVPPTSYRAVAIVVLENGDRQPIAGATCRLQDGPGWVEAVSNADGYVIWERVTTTLRATQVECTAPQYVPNSEHRDLLTGDNENLKEMYLVAEHVDPTNISLEVLAQMRGSMWTARLNLPYGPRPNQDSNINAFAYYELYSAADRQRMRDSYKARGYTHTVHGPVTGNGCYREMYPTSGAPGLLAGCLHNDRLPTQDEWERYLDGIQEIWDAGLVPVYFAKPDGWERAEHAAQLDQLDALYRQPRAQRLLRVVVYPGWEPSGDKYGWSNAMYVRMLKRGADVFPQALRGLHLVADLDSPVGDGDDNMNAQGWVNVAPYIHFFAGQVGGYVFGNSEVPTPTFMDEMCKHMRRYRAGFYEGYAGWPTFSAWGNRPILNIAAEYAAYGNFLWDWHERYSVQIGDQAMRCGADGYLDGGSVSVPYEN